MYERFSDRARKIMALANQECQNLQHICIEPIHVLLGLVKERQSVAVRTLQAINYAFNIRVVREAIESAKLPTTENPPQGRYTQSEQTKQLVQDAVAIARRLNHNYVGSEHLLMALASTTDQNTVVVREKISLPRAEDIEKAVLDLLGDDVDPQPHTPQPTTLPLDPDDNDEREILQRKLFGDEAQVSSQKISVLLPADIATLLVHCSIEGVLSRDLFRSEIAKLNVRDGPH